MRSEVDRATAASLVLGLCWLACALYTLHVFEEPDEPLSPSSPPRFADKSRGGYGALENGDAGQRTGAARGSLNRARDDKAAPPRSPTLSLARGGVRAAAGRRARVLALVLAVVAFSLAAEILIGASSLLCLRAFGWTAEVASMFTRAGEGGS